MIRLLMVLVALLLALPSWAATSCSVTPTNRDGVKHYRVRVEETGSRDTTEVACTGLPTYGTLVSYRADLTAGTGTTIHPILGSAAAFVVSTLDYIGGATATAGFINEQSTTRMHLPAGILYLRSAPNSTATDHAISTEILIVEGVL